MRKLKIAAIFLIFTLLLSGLTVEGLIHNIDWNNSEIVLQTGDDDFYFVHLTDTHIRHKLFDRNQVTTKILKSVIEEVTSFSPKPAFIVITGDLCEWAGSDPFGALNCKAFVSCFYENDNQLYADSEFTIPVYTTPGNHDYCITRNLKNYHTYIDKNHVEDDDRYIVTHGDVSLFFMDSGPNYYDNPFDWLEVLGDGLYDDDIEWLEEELIQCESMHKIILMHHPAISDRNKQGEMREVIARNRIEFVELCENYDVELVLTGHTHSAIIYDCDENKYSELPLNCSEYSTLYVQSDDCKEGVHFRNITIIGDDIWLESSEELDVGISLIKHRSYQFTERFFYLFSKLLGERHI